MAQTVILRSDAQRDLAKRLIDKAPVDAVVKVSEARRTNAQNDLMWSRLADIARSKPQGRVMPAEIWKCVFLSSLGHKCEFVPDLDGSGVVPVGFRSSRMSKAQISDMLDAMDAYGSEHGVRWSI
jgi:hypothetical protein